MTSHKIEHFFLNVGQSDADVVIFTERWLKDDAQSSELFSNNFNAFVTEILIEKEVC